MHPATGANLVDIPAIWPKRILKHHFGVCMTDYGSKFLPKNLRFGTIRLQ